MRYEKAVRMCRARVVEALDMLADREGPMPSNDAGSAVGRATTHLVEARRALDRYLDGLTGDFREESER